jgi:hypothetical protein
MKTVLVVLLVVLSGCKCAVVISADGTSELAYCSSDFLATCVPTYCPDGAYTLHGADKIGGDAVIRCLSHDAGTPETK